MSLAWTITPDGAMGEESSDHVRAALFHIRFLRDFLIRTGLTERAEEIGWIYGDGIAYYGFGPFDMEYDHLNRILAILDIPLEGASIDHASDLDHGYERLEDLGSGEVLESCEDDLLVTFSGEQEDLDAFVDDLKALDSKKHVRPNGVPANGVTEQLVFCKRRRSEAEDGTLAATFAAEQESEEAPHVALLLRDSAMETFSLYDGLFDALITVWERRRGTPDKEREVGDGS